MPCASGLVINQCPCRIIDKPNGSRSAGGSKPLLST